MSYLIDANVNNVKVSGNTDPYTLTSTDEIFLAQDNQIVILPEPTIVNKGRTYTIKLNGSFTSGVFVRNHLSSLIYTINKDYGTVNIISDGTTWVVLADAIQVSEIATTTYVQETTWNNVGAWNGIDTYNAKDVVSYEGSSWLALQTSTNSTPVEGADWTLIASKGDQGLQGDAGANGADGADGVSITSATIDINGDLLIEYSNDLGNPTNVGHVVGANGTNGTNGVDAIWYFQGAWSDVTNYVQGDIVTYQGQTWYSLQPNNNINPVEGATWTLIASSAFVEDWLPIVDTDPTAGDFAGIGVGDRGLLIRGDSNTSPVALFYDDSANKVYLKGAQANSGADFYLEAGNSTTSNGGKIRLYGGDAIAGSNGHGGYVRLRGGTTNDANVIGGYVELQGGNSALGNGGYIDLTAGQSLGNSGNGGYVNISAGNGDAIGGNITLTAGQGIIGGTITLHGGQATNGAGGSVTIEGGYASGVGNTSGAINISSGEIGFVGGAMVGDVNIFTPNADNDGSAGDVNITAGNSGATVNLPSGNRIGGSISITAGNSNSDLTGSNGGYVTISTGQASDNIGGNTANGGTLTLHTGDSLTNGNGGDINITTGYGTIDGGQITFTLGASSTGDGGGVVFDMGSSVNGQGGSFEATAGVSTNGLGGAISLTAGASVNSEGGGITLQAGTAVAGTNGGSVDINAGGGNSGSGGSVNINSGSTNTGNAGAIGLQTGSAMTEGNGGNITLQTGTGFGASYFAGNIILNPGDASNGAGAGYVEVQGYFNVTESMTVPVISMTDNQASALDIKVYNDSYLNFVTTDNAEKIVASQKVEVLSDLSVIGGSLAFNVKDGDLNTVFTIDSNNGDTTISGDLIVTGSLTINGSTTTINTVNLNVTDSLIQLADGVTGAPTNDAGFIIARGDENNASLFWNEANDKFVFATATSLNSNFSGNILTAGGTITYSAVRLGSLEANSIGGIGASTLSVTGNLIGNADTSSSWLNPMTLNLGGDLSGSVAFNGSSTVTLNATLGTVSIANLEYSSINIGGSNISLGGTLNLENLAITGSTLGLNIGSGVITNANLENSSINIGGSNIALGGTLNLSSDFAFDGGTLVLGGTLSVYSTGAIALAKTINLAGAITGSINLNDQTSAVTLNTSYSGTITNADLEYSSINIGGSNISLGGTLNVAGDSYITLGVTGSTLSASLSTIDNAQLEYSSINIGGSNISLGGTINLDGGLSVTGSTLSVGNVATSSSWLNAMTLSIGGTILTGSISFNGSSPVTLLADVVPNSITGGMIANATITNSNLINNSINIDGVNFSLGSTLNVVGDSYITLGVTGTTLSASLGTINNAILENDSVRIGSYDLSLGGTLNLSDLAITGSTLGLNIGNNVITNANLVNDSVSIGGSYSLALGGTLNLENLAITGGTLSLATTINLTDEAANALEFAEGANTYLKFITTGGAEEVYLGKPLSLSTINLTDNQSTALDIIEGANSYLKFVTSNDAERIVVGKKLTPADNSGLEIAINDNLSTALNIHESGSVYFKLVSSNGLEKVVVGKTLDVSDNNITNVGDIALDSISADASSIAINLTDNQSTALDITEGANSYLKFDTTDTAEKIQASKTLEVKGGNLTIKDSTGNTTLYTFNNLLSSASVTTKSSLDIQTFGGVSKFNVDNTTGNTTIKGVAKVENDLVAQSKAILNGNAIINGVAQFENTIIANQIKTSNDILVYDGAPATPQTLYLYVKYNNYSQSDNEYFYIYKTTDYGITREIVPLTSLANLQEDTSLGYKRYRANAGNTYNNTTNPATVNASFVVDSNYTYYLTIRTDLDDSGLPKDFQAYISTSNSENNPTYNDLLILDDSSSHTTDWKITAGSSSWGIAYLLSSSSISDRATTPSSPNLKFDVDSTTGVATLGTNASLKVNKATSASSPLIILNSDTTLTAHQDAVISVERGSGTDAQLKWDNTNTLWSADNATGTARPLVLHSPVDTSITTSTPVSLTGNAKGEYEKIYLVANNNTAITINLFALGSNYDGYKVIIKKIDSGTGAITISPNGTDNIDGANSSISISIAYGSVTLLAQGSNWWVL